MDAVSSTPKYLAEIIGPQIRGLLGTNDFSQRLVTDIMLEIKDRHNKFGFISELRGLLRAPMIKERTFVDFCILFRKYGIPQLTADEWAIIQNRFVQKLIKQRNIAAIAALIASILAGAGLLANRSNDTSKIEPIKILSERK